MKRGNPASSSRRDIPVEENRLKPPVASAWIESYTQNRDFAICDLVQFFISSSGCKGTVVRSLILNSKYPDLIRRMTEEFDDESGDYPIISASPLWKKFRQSFCDFIQQLVSQCQLSIIYDQFLMDHVISLLPVMADSQVRAFRHTGTLAAMKLMTALVDAAVKLLQNLEKTARQLETENMKPRKGNEKLDLLNQNKVEFEQCLEELRNMLAYVFKSVFVHRYRDVVPDIRCICISELGIWMSKFPQMFLDDSYLKYIGWTLHDKVGEVRLKCLQTLLPLYEDEQLGSKMELFTNKFKARIVSMTLDKEPEAAVYAVKLITLLAKHYRDVLTDKECESIYELVYASHRPLAVAAGEFLNARLFFPAQNAAVVMNGKTRRGKPRSHNTPLIRDLLLFYTESDIHQHAAYLVDALLDSNDMLKDWECMTDLLLEEFGRDERPLSDKEERILVEIMTCALKQTASQEPPVIRVLPKKQYVSHKDQNKLHEDRAKLSQHFIVTLPSLIQKFIADPEKLANLLQIPQFFDLELYTSMRQEKHLDALLNYLDEVLEKHIDEEVLVNLAKTFEFLCTNQTSIRQRCETAKSKTFDSLTVALRRNLAHVYENPDDVDEQDLAALLASFRKISVINGYHDISQWGLLDTFFNIIEPTEEDSVIPPEVIEKAVKCCFFSLAWELRRMLDTGFDGEKAEALREKVLKFFGACRELLSAELTELRETAFISVCDLCILYGWQLGERNKAFASLVVEPDLILETILVGFVITYVFIDAEEEELDEQHQIEVMHRRRNLLGGFCKLLINQVLKTKSAAEIFRHYGKFFTDYGDIIKTTITKLRDSSRVQCARALAVALTTQFSFLKEEAENGQIDPQTDGFANLRELAKKFGTCFGTDLVRYREALACLHKEGIDFAIHGDRHTNETAAPPPNLAFLDILSELANKLLKQDKKVVLQYLFKHIALPAEPDFSWQPLLVYRNSLMLGEEMPAPQMILPEAISSVKRGRGRPAKAGVSTLSGAFVPMATSTVNRMDGPASKRQRIYSDQASDAGGDDQGRTTPLGSAPPSFLA